jgi:tripartite-type tricarboxylate transporter receptor subunit TctC
LTLSTVFNSLLKNQVTGEKNGEEIMIKKHVRSVIHGMLVASAMISSALAAENYPTKPIKLYVGLGAGGGGDTLTRQIADIVARNLGQAVVVDNKPGAGGAIVASFLYTQAPDGYTVAMIPSAALTLAPLQGPLAYKPDEFTYLATVMRRSTGLVARGDAAFKGWKALVDYAKEKGGVTYATMTPGDRLAVEKLAKEAGINVRMVPSKGGAETRQMVLGGHVDFGLSGSIGFKDAIDGGPMQILAVLDPQRNADYDSTPTLKELGFDVTLLDHYVFAAPPNTPPEIVEKLSVALRAATKDPGISKLIDEVIGGTALDLAGKETRELMNTETASYKQLLGK